MPFDPSLSFVFTLLSILWMAIPILIIYWVAMMIIRFVRAQEQTAKALQHNHPTLRAGQLASGRRVCL